MNNSLDNNVNVELMCNKLENAFYPSKKHAYKIRLHLEVGKASPAPPVGPAFSQRKAKNMMQFCQQFNASTKDYPAGLKLPVEIYIFNDGSWEFKILKMTSSDMIKKKANIKKGSSLAGREKHVATISQADLEDIAKAKFGDLNAKNLEGAMKIIASTARSMNVAVVQ